MFEASSYLDIRRQVLRYIGEFLPQSEFSPVFKFCDQSNDKLGTGASLCSLTVDVAQSITSFFHGTGWHFFSLLFEGFFH